MNNPNTPPGEPLLTVEQLAARLQYKPNWVRAQVKLGRIPAIRFNARAWRFHWPTVLAALNHPSVKPYSAST